jgi:4-hydroxy-4-methyl-2-oxoglutarate aldolase
MRSPNSTTDASTAHLADACLRLGVPIRCAPHSLRPVADSMTAHGRARPVRHFGSVDVFLEALSHATAGDVMVVDNGGRLDEACVGDLIALEVMGAGLAGIVIWGLHRDTREIIDIGLPIFSLGALPAGPQRLDARTSDTFSWADVGPHRVTSADFVVANEDGVLFLPLARLDEIVETANAIRETEQRQSQMIKSGRSLREQLDFDEYVVRRDADPDYSFRRHLRANSAAIEE